MEPDSRRPTSPARNPSVGGVSGDTHALGPTRATERPRAVVPLTGIRLFAALWVVLHHLRTGISKRWPDAEGLILFLEHGYLGVDLFAFLSGFVIAHNYVGPLGGGARAEILRYVWLRAVRIFPLHWFALFVLAGSLWLVPAFGSHRIDTGRYGAADFVWHAAMLHGWGFADHYAWNVPSWTVSAEWLCYLLFPLVAPLLVRLRHASDPFFGAAFAIGATTLALRALGYPAFTATHDWGALRIGGEFLAGALLQRAWALGFGRGGPWAAIGIGAFALAGWLGTVRDMQPLIVLAFAVGIFALAHGGGPLAWALSRRPIVWGGEISYSIYLMHWVVIRLFEYLRPDPLAGTRWAGSVAPALVAYLAAILLASVAAHYAVDAPARRRLRALVAAR